MSAVAMSMDLYRMKMQKTLHTPTMKWHRLGASWSTNCVLRRLVEAGVTVKIEGTQTVLTTWQDFYEWAHGRYHKLEDGYDRWIGDDN